MEQTKEEKAGVTNHFVVFVFVLTKMVSLPGRPPVKVYEYVTDGDHSVRCDSTEDIFRFIQDCQQYTLVRQGLSSIQFEEQIKIDLWSSSGQSEPKYTLRVVDQQKKTKNGLFAIFIVPQGRETNWLFSTNNGCCQLAESAGFERLVIVTLHRDHTYQGVDKVKEEISSKVVELQQNGLPKNGKWPVLTLGESVGARTVLHKDSSPFSGDFIVEEVEGDDEEWIRKLVYLSTPYLAQTEISLKPAISSKKGKSKSQKQSKDSATEPQYLSKPANLELDHTHLLLDYHKVIIASLSLINGVNWKRSPLESETVNMLTVGLGGGALPMYMMTCLSPQISQDVVELDPKMLQTACKWFGFKHDELTTSTDVGHDTQIKVHIQNGVDFIMKAAADGMKYNAVIFDVDSKDIATGLSSPPVEFTTLEFLTSVRLILKDGGIFITNLCARNKVMESDAALSICKVFETVLEIEISGSINKVFVGLPEMWSDVIGLKDVSMLSDKVTDALYRTVKFKLSKPLKQRINQFSSSVNYSNEDMFDSICNILNSCFVHFIPDKNNNKDKLPMQHTCTTPSMNY